MLTPRLTITGIDETLQQLEGLPLQLALSLVVELEWFGLLVERLASSVAWRVVSWPFQQPCSRLVVRANASVERSADVAVEAEYSETWRVPLCLEPLVDSVLAAHLPSVGSPVVVGVVNCQEAKLILAAARTHATVAGYYDSPDTAQVPPPQPGRGFCSSFDLVTLLARLRFACVRLLAKDADTFRSAAVEEGSAAQLVLQPVRGTQRPATLSRLQAPRATAALHASVDYFALLLCTGWHSRNLPHKCGYVNANT